MERIHHRFSKAIPSFFAQKLIHYKTYESKDVTSIALVYGAHAHRL